MADAKVGSWQRDPEDYDDAECVYDDRGQLVGGYEHRPDRGYRWWAAMPLRSAAQGYADTPSDARSRVSESLETWADVSAMKGSK